MFNYVNMINIYEVILSIMIRLLKKKGFIALFIFILFIIVSIVIVRTINDKSTSLLQAYNIAYSEACKWSDTPEICLITSVDEPDSNSEQGKNGKRRYWNMIFADSNSSDKEFIISIRDKTVKVKPIQQEINRTQFIIMDDLVLTSEKAVSSAVNDYGLLPGQDWAKGYHFVLRSFDNNIDFQVVGLGDDNKMMRIAFDGSNGNFIKVLMSNKSNVE